MYLCISTSDLNFLKYFKDYVKVVVVLLLSAVWSLENQAIMRKKKNLREYNNIILIVSFLKAT